MEANRQIEILELIKETLVETKVIGICTALNNIGYLSKITVLEYDYIKQFLKVNKPTPDNEYSEFTKGKFWRKGNYPIEQAFWWVENFNPETITIRLEYLDALINHVKKRIKI